MFFRVVQSTDVLHNCDTNWRLTEVDVALKACPNRRSHLEAATIKMASYSCSNYWTIWRRLPKLLYPFMMVLVVIHSFWVSYDITITSHQRYRPKREPVRVTESSPLSPYYPPSPGMEYNGYTRAFPVWDKPFPCGELENDQAMRTRSPATKGLFYVKLFETSSSIFSSVSARIARNMGRRQQKGTSQEGDNSNVCTTRIGTQRARRYHDRSPRGSFLWTVVREPIGRLVSKYYHYAHSKETRNGNRPVSITEFQNYILSSEHQDYGYYFRMLAVDRSLSPYNKEHEADTREILESYDFLGISERIDESLAVLKLILGLEIQDVLYLPTPKAIATGSKDNSGNFDYYENWKRQECRPIAKPTISQEMKEWFYSEEFEAFIEADVMFYKAANASLDKTISELGQERVKKTVQQIKWAQEQVQENCKDVRFPCSSKGEHREDTDCLFADIGCGYDCIDKLSQTLAKNPTYQKLST